MPGRLQYNHIKVPGRLCTIIGLSMTSDPGRLLYNPIKVSGRLQGTNAWSLAI